MTKTVMTREIAQKVIETVDKGLTSGLGKPVPGQMCVEAAVCYALGLPHGDKPSCVGKAVQAFQIRLNDLDWSSNAARASGMRRLAVAQLGSDQIDQRAFAQEVTLQAIKQILPLALRAAALESAANACARITSFDQATAVAEQAYTAAIAAHADAAAHAAHAYTYARTTAAAADADAYAAYAVAAAAAAAIAALKSAANACARITSFDQATAVAEQAYTAAIAAAADAAAHAAAYAAHAYTYARTDAVGAAVADAAVSTYLDDAAAAAAHAVGVNARVYDSVLLKVAEIDIHALVKLGSPGVQWLSLCDEACCA